MSTVRSRPVRGAGTADYTDSQRLSGASYERSLPLDSSNAFRYAKCMIAVMEEIAAG
jgi:hypothetical protein